MLNKMDQARADNEKKRKAVSTYVLSAIRTLCLFKLFHEVASTGV